MIENAKSKGWITRGRKKRHNLVRQMYAGLTNQHTHTFLRLAALLESTNPRTGAKNVCKHRKYIIPELLQCEHAQKRLFFQKVEELWKVPVGAKAQIKLRLKRRVFR